MPGRRGRVLEAAASVAEVCGPPAGARIVHISDLHNRLLGARFARALVHAVGARVLVNTGDLSGLGPLLEAPLARAFSGLGVPHVFAPGNHDSPGTAASLARAGASVLREPAVVEAGGLSFWGYPDPNRTPLFTGRYDPQLCVRRAQALKGPATPAIAAVHNALMVPSGDFPLVLSGHMHSPLVEGRSGGLHIRCGSTGGGRPLGWPLHAAVADLMPDLRPSRVWMVALDRRGWKVTASGPFDRTGPAST